MNETALKIKKGLAIIMIWVLMFNNIPMMNLLVNAQESVDIEINEENNYGRNYVIDYPENHLFSVSCGDLDWKNYTYVIQEMPVGSVSCGDQLDVSGCDLPAKFVINKLSGEEVAENINVTINALKTGIAFNDSLMALGGEFVYGTSKTLNCEASIVEGLSEGRTITYAITEGADIAEISGTGELTFKDGMFGTVKVKASVGATNRYAAAEAECAIDVVCVTPAGLEYFKLNESNEKVEPVSAKSAYNHSVGIFAPEGYELLTSNEIDNPTKIESILISQVGTYEQTVYLRNSETGAISSKIDLSIEIDQTAPELSGVEFSKWFRVEKLNDNGTSDGDYTEPYNPSLSDGSKFNLYYNDAVDMTFFFTESDLQVVAKNQYGNIVTLNWENGGDGDSYVKKATYNVPKYSGTHYVTLEISDLAGNTFTYRSENIVICNSSNVIQAYATDKTPVYIENGRGEQVEVDNFIQGVDINSKIYYDASYISAMFKFNNYDTPRVWDTYQNTTKEMNGYWLYNNTYNQWLYYIDIGEEGEHRLNFWRSVDGVSSQTIEYFILDCYAPIITAEHDGTCDLVLDGDNNKITLNPEYKYGEHPEYKLYYQDNTTLKFSIKEVSFDKNNVKFYDSYYVDDELRNVEWKQNGDVWTVEYPLTEESAGVHQITIECTDKLGKYSEYTSEYIVIDNTPAQWAEPKVKYTEWLTDGTIFGDPDYPDLEGYQPGTDSNVKLYFNEDMSITFYVKKGYFNPDYVKMVDHYKSERGNESNIEVSLDWERIDNSDIWKATYEIPKLKVGEHVIELAYKRVNADTNDISWTFEKINIIDTDLPDFQEVIYAGFSRVENPDGDVVNIDPEDGSLINDTMKVYAHQELVLNFLFKDASEADINKLKIVDTYKGVRREKHPVEWTNSETACEEWSTAYKVLPTEPGEHVITVEYVTDTGEDIKLITSALITMDNKKAELKKVSFHVSSGDSVVLEPTYSTMHGDGITRYYNQNVEIDFEIDEVLFAENDFVISDVDEDGNARELQYSVEFADGKYHVFCLIPDTEEGMHKVTLKYLDRAYNEDIFYETVVVIDTILPEKGTISYDKPVLESDTEVYFREDATISFEITETNFKKERLELIHTRSLNSKPGEESTVTIKANGPGREKLHWTRSADSNVWIVTYTIPQAEYGKHNVTLKYKEWEQNGEILFETKTIVMDQAPSSDIEIDYSLPVQSDYTDGNNVKTLYFDTKSSDLVVIIKMIEDNFDERNLQFTDSYFGDENIDLDWDQIYENDCVKVKAEYKILKENEGEHVLNMIYEDPLEDKDVNFTSHKLNIDTEPAEITGIDYSPAKYKDNSSNDGKVYYNSTTDAIVTFYIKDFNFYHNNIKVENLYNMSEGISYNIDYVNWQHVVKCTLPKDKNAEYKLRLTYSAWSGTVSKETREIIIDNTAAQKGDIQYSDWEKAEYYVEDGYGDLIDRDKIMNDHNIKNREDIILYYKDENPDSDEDKVAVTFHVNEKYFHPEGVSLSHNGATVSDPNSWTWTNVERDTYSVTYQISKADAGDHVITMTYQDICSNGEPIVFTSKRIRIDNQAPVFSTSYDGWISVRNERDGAVLDPYVAGTYSNVRMFYNAEEAVVLHFEITDNYFRDRDVKFKDSYDNSVNGSVLTWERVGESEVWTATYTIPKTAQGLHIIRLEYQDCSNNFPINYLSEYIFIDGSAASMETPTFNRQYDWAEDITNDGAKLDSYEIDSRDDVRLYYSDDMQIVFKITEENFYPLDVILCDTYKPKPNTIELTWEPNEDYTVWTGVYTIPKSEAGEHIVTLKYKDNSSTEYTVDYTSEHIFMDGERPTVELTFADSPVENSLDDEVDYYSRNQQAKIRITEDNFRISDVEISVTAEDAVEAIDLDAFSDWLENSENWEHSGNVHTATLDFDIDACYDITVKYRDLAKREDVLAHSTIVVDKKNPVVYSLETEEAYDTDSESFTRMVDEENHTVTTATADTRFVYADAMTFKFAIEEINFNPEDVNVVVMRGDDELVQGVDYDYDPEENWSTSSYVHTLTLQLGKKNGSIVDGDYQVIITYKDLAGRELSKYTGNIITIDGTKPVVDIVYDNNESKNGAYYPEARIATVTVKDKNVVSDEIRVNVTTTDIDGNAVPFDLNAKQSPWEYDEGTNTWSSKITCDVDANYEITVACNDMAEREAADSDSFTVDKIAPAKSSFNITYSDPKGVDANNAYYKDSVTVTITAKDVTSPIDYFEWTYIKQQGASSINQDRENHIIYNSDSAFTYDENAHTASAQFTLTAEQARQYRGNLRFKATDMAGNTSEELTDEEQIVIVDNIDPQRTVSYSAASQVVNKSTLETITGFNYADENVNAVLYYNAPMAITFNVNEANFIKEDVVVKVNDVTTRIDNWTKNGDIWSGSLGISANGEYIVTLQYKDRSTNEMRDYVSHEIVIDTLKPQIKVTYGPNDIRQQVDGIKYYDKQQVATISITERNFRAEDIEVVVTATDVNGNNINITDYDSYLKRRSSWSGQGDTHTAQITFATDANYEFDIVYKDLALIPADDYTKDVFTVDQTAPTNVSVSYSSPIFEKVAQGITYEYYNEPIVVTITAEDDVSGVFAFDYSYFRAENASSINQGNVTNTLTAPKITYSNGKKTAKAVFVIPASELKAGTQINGNMEYIAYNKSLIPTELKDTKRYVADNVAPNVTVEYNDSVRNANNISYYAGNIDVTITVDEANFYADDVKVSISKDGGERYTPNVSWRRISVDKHIGTFTLEEEGDYKVYVSYRDPSANSANEYQSGQLTIDLTKPNVTVSGIKNNSANNSETIGFVVTVEDTNLNMDSFSPRLLAEVQDESGKLKQVDCTDIGTVETVVNGKSCTYTIANIDQDGIYGFTCEVSDMSDNTTEDMIITDSGNRKVSKLEYSVNRGGSTYGLDENTQKLNNSYLTEAKDIVVYETNPDEISNIKITLFKNDESIVLEEGKGYVVNKISGDGEWYKYEYIIYATNFLEDGTYRISIYSEDKAGNVAENNLDVKAMEINFAVDNTLPKLIVINLEEKKTYPLDKLSVLMQATDNMKLVNIEVELDGEVVASWDEKQIQQMSDDLEDFVFDILGTSTQAHTVTISLTDIAGNEYVETISNFYVTRNLWVRFMNNKLLFYGSIVTCITAGGAFVPLWKRRKKRKAVKA